MLQSLECVSDGIKYSILWLASGLAVGDGNDENGLPELTLLSPAENDLINDLLAERSTHGSEALELNTTHNLLNLSFSGNTVLERAALLVTHTRKISVHEADRDTVDVEECGSE